MRTTWPRSSARFVGLPASARVDSNSTRTESCAAMGPDPEAQMQVDAPKAADHSGYQQIIRPSWGMQAGLKILCPISLQGSGSTECGRGKHPGRFPCSQETPRSILTQFPRDGITGDEARRSDGIHLERETSRFRWLRGLAITCRRTGP